MTPKEKAEELFNRYCIYLRAGLLYDDEAREDAKQCALIAVDFYLTEFESWSIAICCGEDFSYDYWEKVKEEIEKIII
jgi:hypothetical protein